MAEQKAGKESKKLESKQQTGSKKSESKQQAGSKKRKPGKLRKPLGPNDFYCLRCKNVRKSRATTNIEATKDKRGKLRLVSSCKTCKSTLYKYVKEALWKKFQKK